MYVHTIAMSTKYGYKRTINMSFTLEFQKNNDTHSPTLNEKEINIQKRHFYYFLNIM